MPTRSFAQSARKRLVAAIVRLALHMSSVAGAQSAVEVVARYAVEREDVVETERTARRLKAHPDLARRYALRRAASLGPSGILSACALTRLCMKPRPRNDLMNAGVCVMRRIAGDAWN